MYKLRNYLLCALTAILLFFAAFAAEGAYIIKFYALDPSSCKHVLEQNDSYEKAYRELTKHFEIEENATGIPADVYTEAVTPELLTELINMQIDAAYDCIDGKTEKIDTLASLQKLDVLKDSVDKFFDEYAKSIGYTKDDAYYEKTEAVFNSAFEYIMDTSDVFQFKKIEKAGFFSKAAKLARYSDTLIYASFGITGFLVLLLFILNIKGFSGFFYWLSISLGSVSFIAVAGSIALKHSHYFNRFAIKTQHIYSAVTGICYYFTDIMLMINVLLLLLSVIMMIVFWIAGRKKVSVQ